MRLLKHTVCQDRSFTGMICPPPLDRGAHVSALAHSRLCLPSLLWVLFNTVLMCSYFFIASILLVCTDVLPCFENARVGKPSVEILSSSFGRQASRQQAVVGLLCGENS